MEIFVQGIGIVGGFGAGIQAFSGALAEGLPKTQTVTAKTPDGLREMPVYIADTSRLDAFVQKKTLRRMDHYSKMALLGAYLALEDADAFHIDRKSLGVMVASGYGASRSTCSFLDSFIEGNDTFASPTYFSNSVHNAAAANISIALGVTGPCLTVCQFEMSVPSALISAFKWLQEKRVDKVLFGALDEYCDVLGYCWSRLYGPYDSTSALNPLQFTEQTAILGEGAAFFLLSLDQGSKARYGKISKVMMERAEAFDLPDHDKTFFILGADGHKTWGRRYEENVKESMKVASYTPLYGSFPTNMAFDMAAACSSIRSRRVYGQPKGWSCRSSLRVVSEEQPLDAERICCLKLAGNKEAGLITISRD